MATYIPLDQGVGFQMGGGDSRRLISDEIGARLLTMNYSVFQPGQEFPQHFHDESVDIFIVLEGGVSVRQGETYTPIEAGDFAYIPAGEIHGTVNQTDEQAILISFQSPPDAALYRGERDSSTTGAAPTPPPGHVSTIRIDSLTTGDSRSRSGTQDWIVVAPGAGANSMGLSYHVLEPEAVIALPAEEKTEAVWFVWSGEIVHHSRDERLTVPQYGVVFVPPDEIQQITNNGAEPARLIRCVASSDSSDVAS